MSLRPGTAESSRNDGEAFSIPNSALLALTGATDAESSGSKQHKQSATVRRLLVYRKGFHSLLEDAVSGARQEHRVASHESYAEPTHIFFYARLSLIVFRHQMKCTPNLPSTMSKLRQLWTGRDIDKCTQSVKLTAAVVVEAVVHW